MYGIRASGKELEGLIDRYDRDRDGIVSYGEFVDEVRPKSPKRY
jgi:Ca2+-binding EF-hand superfamily protein